MCQAIMVGAREKIVNKAYIIIAPWSLQPDGGDSDRR
jgi:hypothetical protein